MDNSPQGQPAQKRSRTFTIVLFAALICSVLIGLGASNNSLNRIVRQRLGKTPHIHQTASAIDISIEPKLIPDSKAYSLLFRFLSKAHTEAQERVNRSLIKKMGVADDDIDTLIAASREFNNLVSELDRQALKIKQSNHVNPSSEVIAQLSQLDQQKEGIVTKIVSSLPSRLDRNSVENLRHYVNEKFKRQMKIVSLQ